MKNIHTMVLTIFCFLMLHRSEACTCLRYNKIDIRQFNDYDIIVKGTILGVEENREAWEKRILVKVKKVYKNIVTTDTLTFITGLDEASCGLHFEQGEEWMLYGYGRDSEFSTGLCTRSTKLNFFKNLKLGSEKRFLRRYKTFSGKINTASSKGELKNGKPIGPWFHRRKDIIWKSYRYSEEGLLHGLSKSFWDNGSLHYAEEYDNGRVVRTSYYDKKGNIKKIVDH